MAQFTIFADGASGRAVMAHHDVLEDAIDHAEMLAGQKGIRYQNVASNSIRDKHARDNAARIVVTDSEGRDVFTTHMRYR